MNQILSPELSERVRHLSDEALVLTLDAFAQGRAAAAAQLGAYCQQLLAELEQQHDSLTPAAVEQIEMIYRVAGSSSAVTAHFGGAADVIERMKDELRRLGWSE